MISHVHTCTYNVYVLSVTSPQDSIHSPRSTFSSHQIYTFGPSRFNFTVTPRHRAEAKRTDPPQQKHFCLFRFSRNDVPRLSVVVCVRITTCTYMVTCTMHPCDVTLRLQTPFFFPSFFFAFLSNYSRTNTNVPKWTWHLSLKIIGIC